VLILVLLLVSFITVMFCLNYLISLTHSCFTAFLSMYIVLIAIDLFSCTAARVFNELTYLHVVVKQCTKFESNRAIRGGVITISICDLMTLNIFACCACAWLWDNLHQVWTMSTYLCLTNSVFFAAETLCHAVTLTVNVCGTSDIRGL